MTLLYTGLVIGMGLVFMLPYYDKFRLTMLKSKGKENLDLQKRIEILEKELITKEKTYLEATRTMRTAHAEEINKLKSKSRNSTSAEIRNKALKNALDKAEVERDEQTKLIEQMSETIKALNEKIEALNEVREAGGDFREAANERVKQLEDQLAIASKQIDQLKTEVLAEQREKKEAAGEIVKLEEQLRLANETDHISQSHILALQETIDDLKQQLAEKPEPQIKEVVVEKEVTKYVPIDGAEINNTTLDLIQESVGEYFFYPKEKGESQRNDDFQKIMLRQKEFIERLNRVGVDNLSESTKQSLKKEIPHIPIS